MDGLRILCVSDNRELHCLVIAEVLSRLDDQNHQEIPISSTRRKELGTGTGRAAQSFHVDSETPGEPSYVVGTLILPPGADKDPESVGGSAQIFTVVDCQRKSLEVAYADPESAVDDLKDSQATHFHVSKGDNFHVPPGNVYRLINHSQTSDCVISWTIIRDTSEGEDKRTYEEGNDSPYSETY